MPRGSNPGERRGDHQRDATSPLSKTPPEPAPRHRSSSYNEEIATEICKLVADGISLREIARHPKFPGVSAFARWLKEHQDFAEKYASAKRFKIERMAGKIPDIVNARVPNKDRKIERPGNSLASFCGTISSPLFSGFGPNVAFNSLLWLRRMALMRADFLSKRQTEIG